MSNPEEKPNVPQENPTEKEVGGRKAEPTTVPQDKTESGTTVPQDDA